MKESKAFVIESFNELNTLTTICRELLSLGECDYCKYYEDCVGKAAVWIWANIMGPSPSAIKHKFDNMEV